MSWSKDRSRFAAGLGLAIVLATTAVVQAQRQPQIGYVYPAGGRTGTTFYVKISGRYLDGVTNVHVSGGGVEAAVIEHVKPLNGRQINLLRDRQRELQKGLAAAKRGQPTIRVRSATNTNVVETLDRAAAANEVAEIKKKLANPKNRNRDNPQLGEDVALRVTVAQEAEPGARELRLKAAAGLSNPLAFHVGALPEYPEQEPNDKTPATGVLPALPAVLNGQILPGDVDRFRLPLRKGAQLVVVASARALIPYLADAVPGWFQATLALYDAKGNELAYADDYQFHPDPVLAYAIPQDGDYVLEIKDAIYRGREDFVYRITVGELPFVTSWFPLGGRRGTQTSVELKGWNLPASRVTFDSRNQDPGVHPLFVGGQGLVSLPAPFAVDTLPESLEQEPNNEPDKAQRVTPALMVNGRIDQPGDCDVFRFEGRAGDELVAEVYARRLNSPLDSVLRLTDTTGKVLGVNDDHEDKGAGLTTHHADSRLAVTLPADGAYYLHLGDAQSKGGAAYGYRLRISPPRPDFELRVVPSSLNARAGATVPVTVYALRRDGFTNDIVLALKDAPNGFSLSGGRVPADKDQARFTLRVPPRPSTEPLDLRVEGRAVVQGREIVRLAVPADDMMQAFIYRHLVPAEELKVAVIGRPRPNAPGRNPGKKAVRTAPAKPPASK